MKYFIPQINEHDCGYASLKILLSLIYKNKSYLLLNNSKAIKGPLTYKQIQDLAFNHRVRLTGIKFINKAHFNNFKNLPIIASIKNPNGSLHAVVVKQIGRFFVKIIDPAKGVYRLSKKKFYSLWDSTCLYVEKLLKDPDEFKIEQPGLFKYNLISLMIQIFSNASMLFSIFFINNNIHIGLPIGLFTLFALLEITNMYILFKKMNCIDNFYSKRIDLENNCPIDYYKCLEDYKKSFLSNQKNVFISAILITVLSILTLINNPLNFLLIATPLSLTCFDYLLFNNRSQNMLYEIVSMERKLEKKQDMQNSIKMIEKIHKKGYYFSKFMIYKKYIYYFILILMSFITMTLTVNELNLVHIVFYLSIEIILFEQYHKIVKAQNDRYENLKRLVKLHNFLKT